MYADINGFVLDGRIRFSARMVCGMNKSQQFLGKLGSAPSRKEISLDLKVWIARSAWFNLWSPGDAIWYSKCSSSIALISSAEISLSNLSTCAVNPLNLSSS